MANRELSDFLREQCQRRGLSVRRLSVKSGLSPGTVHNIVTRKYQPTLFSLNRLADYLGVKREYLWQLAGLLDGVDYNPQTTLGDPELRFQFAQVDKLPKAARDLVIGLIQTAIAFFDTAKEQNRGE